MNAWTMGGPQGRGPELNDLLDDEVTIAVMRADNVSAADIRRLFCTIARGLDPSSPGGARRSAVPPAS